MSKSNELIEGNRPEWILCAAIHFDDGKKHVHQPKNIETGIVFCGRRHHNCIASRVQTEIARLTPNVQGFITNLDRFVDRKEAGEIAWKAKQITRKTDCLFSEDLY